MQNESRKSINVLIWNLSWLYGRGSEGHGYTPRPKAYFEERLHRAARILSAYDLVLLQEVDFGARRSFFVDQALELARAAGFSTHRKHTSWDQPYVPYPVLPPWSQWGRILAGSVILSKLQLGAERSILFEPVASQPFWVRAFYPRRYAHAVRLTSLPDSPWVVNLHLEAFDAKARSKNAEKLGEWLEDLKKEAPLALVAGDFNSLLAPGTRETEFEDLTGTMSYTDDLTPAKVREQILIPHGLKDVLGLAEDRPEYWTFPTPDVDRRLDYAFVPAKKRMEISDARVLVSTGTLSDHFPIRFTISW